MNTQNKQTQHNTYKIISSNGKESNIYVFASNINEAHKIVKSEHKNIGIYYKLKRCYNGGVRG
jgi:hypothetical protein